MHHRNDAGTTSEDEMGAPAPLLPPIGASLADPGGTVARSRYLEDRRPNALPGQPGLTGVKHFIDNDWYKGAKTKLERLEIRIADLHDATTLKIESERINFNYPSCWMQEALLNHMERLIHQQRDVIWHFENAKDARSSWLESELKRCKKSKQEYVRSLGLAHHRIEMLEIHLEEAEQRQANSGAVTPVNEE